MSEETSIETKAGNLIPLSNALAALGDQDLPLDLAGKVSDAQEAVLKRARMYAKRRNDLLATFTDDPPLSPEEERWPEWEEALRELDDEPVEIHIRPIQHSALARVPGFAVKANHLRVMRDVGVILRPD